MPFVARHCEHTPRLDRPPPALRTAAPSSLPGTQGQRFASAALVFPVSPCFVEVPLLSRGSLRPPVGGAAVTKGTSEGSFCPTHPSREFLASFHPITASPQKTAQHKLGQVYLATCPAPSQGHPPRQPLPRQFLSHPARRPLRHSHCGTATAAPPAAATALAPRLGTKPRQPLPRQRLSNPLRGLAKAPPLRHRPQR